MTPTPIDPRKPKAEREGAAMLVTMLVLLMATAAGMFGVHAASFEIRAAGAQRQRLQAQYVAETGILATRAYIDISPTSHANAIEAPDGTPQVMAPFEPPLVAGKNSLRFYLGDITSAVGTAPVDQDAVGPSSAHEPQIYVDVNDNHKPPTPIVGANAAEEGELRFIRWTFTSRGRLQVRPAIGEITVPGDSHQFHEGASDARSHIVTGPL
jgi:hypothetical protein